LEARVSVSGQLALSEIRPCPFNVRRHFDPADLAADAHAPL
jgi:hypothetical protein